MFNVGFVKFLFHVCMLGGDPRCSSAPAINPTLLGETMRCPCCVLGLSTRHSILCVVSAVGRLFCSVFRIRGSLSYRFSLDPFFHHLKNQPSCVCHLCLVNFFNWCLFLPHGSFCFQGDWLSVVHLHDRSLVNFFSEVPVSHSLPLFLSVLVFLSSRTSSAWSQVLTPSGRKEG